MLGDSILLFSGTKTADGNTKTTPQEVGHRKGGYFFLHCSAMSGTSDPTLDVDILTYDKISAAWYVIGSFTQLLAAGQETIYIPDVGKKIAVQYVIADTNPSFTFKVSCLLKD